MVQHDGSEALHCWLPDAPHWRPLCPLPLGAGWEYAALATRSSNVFLLGGRSRDGSTLRSVHSYDLASSTWTRLPDMR